MGKLEYLDALKRAMLGLPPETQAKTLAWYEQRFVDGVAAGRGEAQIAAELGDPKKVAVTLRANTHLDAFKEKKNPRNLMRVLVSGAGLLVFNLFMVVPAAVYTALLAALYAAALGFYVAGIAIAASGLSGANELVLNGPLREVSFGSDGRRTEQVQTRVSIGETGIQVYQEPASGADRTGEPGTDQSDAVETDGMETESSRVIRGAEAVAERGIQITTELDANSRTTQTLFGLGLVLGGIALILASIVVTRYTVIGIRRYVKMNMSLLRGN